MATARTTARFAEVLLKARLIDELQLKSALAHVERWGGTLPRAIGELGFAEEDSVVDALAKSLKVPAMHLGNVMKDNAALRSLGVDYCEKFGVFPVTLKDRVLTLAMADPTDLDVVDDAGSMARARVTVVMAAESEIRSAIAKHFRGQELPQRRKVSNVRKAPEPGEEKLVFELAAPAKPGKQAAPGRREEASFDLTPPPASFSPEEVRRLEAALQNQEKVGHILRTVQELLAAKGFVPRS
jgi:hypothetical protein